MPSVTDVRPQLVDVIVRVVECADDDVTPQATLTSLGIDSLSVVEIADEIGRRFGVYLADDVVTGLRTVGDIERAVAEHDGTEAPAWVRQAAVAARWTPAEDRGEAIRPRQPTSRAAVRRFAFWTAVFGAVLGLGIGLGGSAVLSAAGLQDAYLPPLAQPTASPSPTPTATESAEPEEPTGDDDEEAAEPTLTAAKTQVPPGERFGLSGEFPDLGSGEVLQVQVRDPGEGWDDFPVTATTRDGGRYETVIYTSRTGEREFRMRHTASGKTTPAVKVQIG